MEVFGCLYLFSFLKQLSACKISGFRRDVMETTLSSVTSQKTEDLKTLHTWYRKVHRLVEQKCATGSFTTMLSSYSQFCKAYFKSCRFKPCSWSLRLKFLRQQFLICQAKPALSIISVVLANFINEVPETLEWRFYLNNNRKWNAVRVFSLLA